MIITAKKMHADSKNAVALSATGKFTIHFALKNGKIYDVSPSQVYAAELGGITFDFDMPAERMRTEAQLADWMTNKAAKQAIHDAELATKQAHEYEVRKANVIGLWNWRHGRCSAWLVDTSEQENSDKSYDYEHERVLFFDEAEARSYFDAIKDTAPDQVGYYFITQLLELKPTRRSLEIMNIDELLHEIIDYGNDVAGNSYAEPIPADHIIIYLYHGQHGSRGVYQGCERPRTWSGWIGSSYLHSQTTYADLAALQDRSYTHYQITDTIAGAVDTYGDVILRDLDLSKEQAIEAGIDSQIVENYYQTEDIN